MNILILIAGCSFLVGIIGVVIWAMWFDRGAHDSQSMIDTMQSISSGGHNHQCEDYFIPGVFVGIAMNDSHYEASYTDQTEGEL